MSKKKTQAAASTNLIESLMEDLKDLDLDSSYQGSTEFSDSIDESVVAAQGSPLWDNLGNVDDSSEYSAESESDILGASAEAFEMPSGLNFPSSSESLGLPEESVFKGPSADSGYQSLDDLLGDVKISPAAPSSVKYDSDRTSALDEATRPANTVASGGGGEDKTVSIQYEGSSIHATDGDKTIAVEGFAQARANRKKPSVDVQVSVGDFRGGASKSVLTSVDASLAQSENLKIAQRRILDLEKEVESLRTENEELSSAGEIIRIRSEELEVKMLYIEKEKVEIHESAQSEILLLKGSLQHRETELAKNRIKVEDLETRLKSDFKKIRVHERELENRLELLRAEKAALVRSKDEYILEQKRKIDQLSQELDNYRKKCLELNRSLEANQDQFKRTERALRLALTNLEVSEDGVVPLKKAE